MSHHYNQIQMLSPKDPTPLPIDSLCRELSHAGKVYLDKIASLIDQVAGTPGRVVYLHATTLPIRLSGLEPVIFSGIDGTTHLQVAQAHLTVTSAAALSFVEFVACSFPFQIVEFKTARAVPFHITGNDRSHRDFPALIAKLGFVHSFIESGQSDALCAITSRMVFGGLSEGVALADSPEELQRVLTQFLFFHNNFRYVPWLEGKTPVQKLRMFDRFQGMHSFNPWESADGNVHAVGTEPLEPKKQQNGMLVRVQRDYR